MAYAALLQVYWMPAYWRALLYLGGGLVGLTLLIRMLHKPLRQIGIDEQGVFLLDRGGYERLLFIRANGVQLIAKADQEQTFWGKIWPKYRVIYRDSVGMEVYQVLRSYAAQQILRRRSEEAKKHFDL
ncbi:hypothetical protein EBI01_08470 [Marinomonas rhizomae]|uniref:hypothetical protein n=1 Tax=Marinomonas rhizomae TaxID=491948 RepID=UPI000DE8ED5A|nr:hypothetical protein [Marinomonas rhizomae]RNF73739.1 hypothetical protein EBI01_08470 [Marinomonas rhizomae]